MEWTEEAKEAVSKFIDQCLDYYQEHCQKGERFGEMLNQKGMNDLKWRLA